MEKHQGLSFPHASRFEHAGICQPKSDGAVLERSGVTDGEGGFCVWGKQTPADTSLKRGYLPLGLAHHVKLKTRYR